MKSQQAENMDTKSILDEVVVLLNVLVMRHIVEKSDAPAWSPTCRTTTRTA